MQSLKHLIENFNKNKNTNNNYNKNIHFALPKILLDMTEPKYPLLI